jgi:hypothetical protein
MVFPWELNVSHNAARALYAFLGHCGAFIGLKKIAKSIGVVQVAMVKKMIHAPAKIQKSSPRTGVGF